MQLPLFIQLSCPLYSPVAFLYKSFSRVVSMPPLYDSKTIVTHSIITTDISRLPNMQSALLAVHLLRSLSCIHGTSLAGKRSLCRFILLNLRPSALVSVFTDACFPFSTYSHFSTSCDPEKKRKKTSVPAMIFIIIVSYRLIPTTTILVITSVICLCIDITTRP